MDSLFSCSIDDGHPSDMRAAELFEKHFINATFYIPIKNREGPPVLSAHAIRELGSQFEIGSHTVDHRFLQHLDEDEAYHQVVEGKNQLEDILGRDVIGFCYPGGKYLEQHTRLVQSAGFSYARTTKNLCFDTGNNAYEMPTTVQFYPHHRSVYARNFAKGGHWRRRSEGLRVALNNNNWIKRLYALFEYSLDEGGVFHLWAHSKDIDDLNAWGEFDLFLAYVAENVAPICRLNNAQLASRGFSNDRMNNDELFDPSTLSPASPPVSFDTV